MMDIFRILQAQRRAQSLDQFLSRPPLPQIRMTRDQMIERMQGHGWQVKIVKYQDTPNMDWIEATAPHFIGTLQIEVDQSAQEFAHRLANIYTMLIDHIRDHVGLHGNA